MTLDFQNNTSEDGEQALKQVHPNGKSIRVGLSRPKRNDEAIFEDIFPDNSDGKLLKALLVVYLTKQEYRMGWARKSACDEPYLHEHSNETVAAHQWGVAKLIMTLCREPKFQEELPTFDRLKAIEMALIHDVPELITGDITPVDGISVDEKHALESEAMNRIVACYPEETGSSIQALYNTYEARVCRESSFVKDCDKLDFMLNAFLLERQGFSGFSEFYPNTKALGFSTRIVTDLAELLTSTRNNLYERNVLYTKHGDLY